MALLTVDILTLFPGMFSGPLSESMVKRAVGRRQAKIRIHDIRRFSTDRHRKCDDRPFGGGPGMVMTPQPVDAALRSVRRRSGGKPWVILMSPQGRRLTQASCHRWVRRNRLAIICGHYEGVDERIRGWADEEISIGDYILTGGEIPAMVLVDAVVRLVPGVLGDPDSLKHESFQGGLLEYPQYTRPAVYRGLKVPEVLRQGDHEAIARWRSAQRVTRTRRRRPDLLMSTY